MRKIIILTTEGGDREDGNVYYASAVLVDTGANASLSFSEPMFSLASDDVFTGDYEAAIDSIEELGYTVERLDVRIVAVDLNAEDEDEYLDEEEDD